MKRRPNQTWESSLREVAASVAAIYPPVAHIETPSGLLALEPGQIAFRHGHWSGDSSEKCLVQAGETCPHGYTVKVTTPKVLSPWLHKDNFTQVRIDRDGNEVASRSITDIVAYHQRIDYQRIELEQQGWTLMERWP
jgi:hypothetical protein